MSDFDTMLWRPLRSGIEYDALIPVTSCKSTYVGNGNTDFSVDEMEKVIEQYAYQTEKVAQKLQRQTIKATTDTIHDFLFNHFQYKADESNQLLRSPACSWFTRKKGIDCKSYTIWAMSLCLNMNLTAYIRRIKQPGYAPEEYTHVYVVVPKDQQTGNLESGYYVIDGTLKNNIEPAFVGKSDKKMSLRHYSLNGVPQHDLNGVSISDIKNIFSFSKIGSIINKVKCMGINGKEKSAYTDALLKIHMDTVDSYFSNLFMKINQAVIDKNFTLFSNLVNEFYGNSKMFVLAAKRNKMKGWNPCTTARIDVNIQQFEFYANTIGQLVNAWLNEYFIKGAASGSVTYDNSQTAQKYPGMRHVSSTVIQSVVQPLINYTAKANEAIPAFVLNEYVQNKANLGQNMDTNAYLDALELAGTFLQGNSANGNGIKPNLNTGGNYVRDLDQTKTTNAGMGWVIGGILTVVGLSFAFKNKKNKLTKE